MDDVRKWLKDNGFERFADLFEDTEIDADALRELFFNTIRRVNRADYDEAQVRAWAPDEMDEKRWQRRFSIGPA